MNEKEFAFKGRCINGFIMLAVELLLIPALAAVINILCFDILAVTIPASVLLFTAWIVISIGFFTQQPNQSRVMIFFGKYRGTFRDTGYFWVNPFISRKKYRCAYAIWT